MPLKSLTEIKHNSADFYITNAYWDSNRYKFQWPCNDYPFSAAIHYTEFREHQSLKIEIRKWIEHNLSETVIFDHVDKSYWDNNLKFQVYSYWIQFWFEDENSCLMFKLKFGEYCSEITERKS